MKVIKFTTQYEPTLSFNDNDFKEKYEERVGNNNAYKQYIDGSLRHLAVCPKCNNAVIILGIYKEINESPHARHKSGIDIPGVLNYNKYNLERCPYHKKKASYVKEYVPETEEPLRKELYKLTKDNFDKAIYLLEEKTGMHISLSMAEKLAENYAATRAYNYIDATNYNIPWYLIYSFNGFPLYHMIVRKGTTLYKHLQNLGINLRESRIEHHVYVEDKRGYILTATDYHYIVNEDNDSLNEWLKFSILEPDNNTNVLLYNSIDRFSISVDSYYFGNLIKYTKWNNNQKLLDIANEYMNP